MIFSGNSNITSIRQQALKTSSNEQISVHWVGALQINNFFDGHPAGAKVRRLFSAEQGWKFLSIGTHDVFSLCHLASRNKQEEYLSMLRDRYHQVFTEFQQDGHFAWLVFPQPLRQVAFPGLTPKDVFVITCRFYDAIKLLCKGLDIPVIDPCAAIIDQNGEPLPHLVQRDGIHLNMDGVRPYLDQVSDITGVKMELTSSKLSFEPTSEAESFCSLLLDEIGIPPCPDLTPSDFKEKLTLFISDILEGKGLDIVVDDEMELVNSGLMDSLCLVEAYSYATDLLMLEIPFDVDLHTLNTISKISNFLFSKKNEFCSQNIGGLSQQDFLLSLRGDYSDLSLQKSIIEADHRIASMDDALFQRFRQEVAIASHGIAIQYGIILFWIALNKASREDYRGALEYIEAASDQRLVFPFQSSRTYSYNTEWRKKMQDQDSRKRLWDLEVDESVLSVKSSAEELLKKDLQAIIDLAEKGNLTQAILALERLTQSHPHIARLSNDLGVLYTRQGNKEKALDAYRKAINSDPNNIIFLKNFADFQYAERGDVAGAFAMYTKALSIKPDDLETLSMLGHICFTDLKRIEDSIYFFSRVRTLDPNNAIAREALALLNSGQMSHSSQHPESGFEKDGTEKESRPSDSANDYLVTALVSTYNSEHFIRGCLEDLEAQTIANRLEIVVVDSCSQQDEKAIIDEFQKKYSNIKYIRTEKRETVYAAWNRGIKAASGKYITNANTDDRHRKDAFEQMIAILENHPEITLVYADVIVTEKENETFDQHTPCGYFTWLEWDRNQLLEKGCFMGPQPMWRKSIHDEYGYFDESMVTSGDYEFWLRISQTHDFYHIKKQLGLYLKSPQSIEHKNGAKQQEENSRILSQYRDAAQKGCIVKYNPIDTLINFSKEKNIEGSKLLEQINQLEQAVQLKSEQSYTNSIWTEQDNNILKTKLKLRDYTESFLLLKKAVQSGNHRRYMKDFISVSSILILSKTNWWPQKFGGKTIPDLTSIIILTEDRLDHIKECIKSIQKHTDQPYEIIFVNNGSSNSTIKWVQSRVKANLNFCIIENKENIGLTKGLNQGINISRGEFIVILDNDVIVSGGWLDSMLQCLNSRSDVGIVGPMTNNSIGIQQITDGSYVSVDHLDKYAAGFKAQYHHRRISCRSIDGFCMLFKRRLTEKIGLLDERFDISRFASEDFCVRAALGNYRNYIAGNVFVHHYGKHESQSGKEIFEKKWTLSMSNPESKKLMVMTAVDLADTLYQKGEIEQAVETLINCIKIAPKAKEIYFELARIFIESKKYSEAWEVIGTMPDLAKTDLRGLECAAYAKEGLGLDTEADEFADMILSQDKNNPVAMNLKGILAYKKEKKREAADYFQKAISSDPAYGEAYTNLGVFFWSMDQKDEAFSYLRKGFILSPKVPDISSLYYSAIASLEKFSNAEADFQEACGLYPGNKKLAFLYIDILIQQGKFDSAILKIEDVLDEFGLEEGTLNAALAVRNKIGPLHIKETQKGSLSLCMIVKNEEKHLVRCLKSVRDISDEIIIVDTGSSDRTIDIATVFGAKIFEFPWTGDFSAARNHSLTQASGDWILILDADEVISKSDFGKLKRLIGKRPASPVAFSIITRNYINDVNIIGWTPNKGQYAEEAGTGWGESKKVRLLPRRKDIYFSGPVHELLEDSLKKAKIPILDCNIVVHHFGKLDMDRGLQKGEDYYLLGKIKHENNPTNLKYLYEFANQTQELGKYEEAVDLWLKLISLAKTSPESSDYSLLEAHILLTTAYMKLNRFDKALETVREAIEKKLNLKDFAHIYAYCEIIAGSLNRAFSSLEEVLKTTPDHIHSLFLMAVIFCLDGKREKAQEIFTSLPRKEVRITPALNELTKQLLIHEKRDDALLILDAAIKNNIKDKETEELFEMLQNKDDLNDLTDRGYHEVLQPS